MSAFRASRLPLLVACAAFALSGCMQSKVPVAKAPRGDLDTLAYGEMQPAEKPAEQGFFGNRTFAGQTSAAPPAKSAAVSSAPVEPAPRVVMADAERAPSAKPAREPSSKSSGGLFAALGMRMQAATPDPMESNAQVPVAYSAPAPAFAPPVPMATRDPDYRVDAGDKLRIVVYGQEGLTNTYAIDAGGGITMPLIGRVAARGLTPVGLAAHITARLRKGYIRDPSVAVEVESYRPFFILGEVAAPGQYPYVPNMSVEAAIAIAGGFSPRARRDAVMLTHKADGGSMREPVPLGTPLSPGDTIMVGERWF